MLLRVCVLCCSTACVHGCTMLSKGAAFELQLLGLLVLVRCCSTTVCMPLGAHATPSCRATPTEGPAVAARELPGQLERRSVRWPHGERVHVIEERKGGVLNLPGQTGGMATRQVMAACGMRVGCQQRGGVALWVVGEMERACM
jgi:hypothetical protein